MRWYKSSTVLQCFLLVCLGGFSLAPILWVLVRSMESGVLYAVDHAWTFLYRYASLELYVEVLFHNLEYWAAYWNTVWLTLPVLVLALLTTSMAAYGLTVMRKKWQGKLLLIYGVLALLPKQVLLVPQLIMLSDMQLTGLRLAVILVAYCSPWYVFFLHRLCKGIPEETFEMARLEGAGEWTVFMRIALPQMSMGIMIFAIIISADLWGMVEEPLVYIQDASKYPLSVLFYEMDEKLSYAGIVLFSLPIMIIFLEGIRSVMKKEGNVA